MYRVIEFCKDFFKGINKAGKLLMHGFNIDCMKSIQYVSAFY